MSYHARTLTRLPPSTWVPPASKIDEWGFTKRGWPHYHLLVRSGYRDYRFVRQVWSELTGAIIVDVRKVKKRDSVYWYLVKYMCKQEHCDFTQRRLSWTKKFLPPKKEMPGLGIVDWKPEPTGLHSWIRFQGRDMTLTPIGKHMWVMG